MGSREKDAFSGLMASVPGVDTSGFIKKSLNDMKGSKGGRSKAPKPKIPPTSPPAPSAGRYASVPTGSPPSSHSFPVDSLNQGERGRQPSSTSAAWQSSATANLGLSDLDALNSWQSAEPAASAPTSAATTPLGDLFDGIPGATTFQTATPAPPPPVAEPKNGDLLGLGEGELAEELGAVTIQNNPPATGSTPFDHRDGSISFDYVGMATKEPGSSFGVGSREAFEPTNTATQEQWSHGGRPFREESFEFNPQPNNAAPPTRDNFQIPGFGEFVPNGRAQEQATVGVGNGATGPKYSSLDSDFGGQDFETYGGGAVENGAGKQKGEGTLFDESDPDVGVDLDYDHVLSSSNAAKKKKLGRIPPQMSTAAKNLLARVSRTSPEQQAPPAQGGKSRFTKYRDNFQKKAVQYSKMGLDAMKQGLGAASDWMDKQLDDRKKSTSGSGSPQERVNPASETDVIAVAVELEALSPMERSVVLDSMHPDMRAKVVDLFHSLRDDDDPQPTTPSPTPAESNPPDWAPVESYEDPPAPVNTSGQRMTRYMSDPDFSRSELDLGRTSKPLHDVGASAPDLTTGEFPVHKHIQQEEEEEEVVVQEDPGCDFLGLDGKAEDTNPPVPEVEPARQPVMADPEDLDSFFGGGAATSTQAEVQPTPPQSQSMDDIFGGSASHQMSHGLSDDLMDMGEGPSSHAAAPSEYSHLYQEQEGATDEPEIRKMLREKRIREKHNKMQEALQDKLMKEQEEVERQEIQYDLKKRVAPKIMEWKDAAQGNIRGLLTSLHTVLWEGSGWKELTVGDVLESNQVKKAYRKANLLVHPDKVRQKNGTDEQIVVADMLFDILKESWGAFER